MAIHPLDYDFEIKFDGKTITCSNLEGHSIDTLARRCVVTRNGIPVAIGFQRNGEGIDVAVYRLENSSPQETTYRRADEAMDLLEYIVNPGVKFIR